MLLRLSLAVKFWEKLENESSMLQTVGHWEQSLLSEE